MAQSLFIKEFSVKAKDMFSFSSSLNKCFSLWTFHKKLIDWLKHHLGLDLITKNCAHADPNPE